MIEYATPAFFPEYVTLWVAEFHDRAPILFYLNVVSFFWASYETLIFILLLSINRERPKIEKKYNIYFIKFLPFTLFFGYMTTSLFFS